MITGIEKAVNYRTYVLFMLLVLCICNLATRNLPSYLITVPVPECEHVCFGVTAYPLCGRHRVDLGRALANPAPTRSEECQYCRSRVVRWPANATSSADRPALSLPSVLGRDGLVKQRQLRSVLSPLELEAGPHMFTDDAPLPDTFAQDATFYNMADGSCLQHWKYGILIGYGFAAVFAAGTLPAGHICDRRPRVLVASAALMTWSVATAVQAAADNFVFLLCCRAAVGFAQAFAIPVAISITADYFHEEQNVALAVLSIGPYLGSGCASLSILFAQWLGWRWAMLWAGLVGIAVAPLFYHTVREPERTKWSAPCFISDVFDEVFYKSRTAALLILAGSAKMCAAYSLSAFLPIWYARQGLVGYSNNRYACLNALVIAVGGLLSTVVGSVLGHHWTERDPRAPCWIGLAGAVLSLPLICVMLLTRSFGLSMLCFFLLLLVSESWFVPTVALLQAAVRKSVRSQAVSMFLTGTTLAANLGPAIVGFVDSGGASVGIHLLWVSLTANVVAALAFVWTARELRVDPVAAGVSSSDHRELAPWSIF